MTADTVGGVWTYTLELCRALAPQGIRVALATMGAWLDAEQRAAVQALPNVDLFERACKLEWMEDPWADVEAAGAWLLEVERAFRPDVIHLNNFVHGALPWREPVLVVGHSCVSSWFEAVKGTRPTPEWDRYCREVARGLRAADLVTAPSHTMRSALTKHYGPISTGPVVPNGRRAQDYRSGRKEPLYLTSGRLWDEAKNVGVLDRIAPTLPWPGYVAGEEVHPDTEGEAAFDGLRRLGRLAPAELAEWMGRASIYVLPARYEPFGLSPLEAALAGCVLVLGDIPSLREVWGDAACFVPPNDADALREVLLNLMADETFRNEKAAAARRRALTYTPERMAEGYLNLYGALLAWRGHTAHRTLRTTSADA
ncbi:MAG TPA: glycosyltransferase family 4 protein [Rhodothermales bacterium]|nr:glycosyltransferase family 4 protein [Rhodothermales bacterium]